MDVEAKVCVYTRNPYNERQNEVAYSSASCLPVEKITQSVEHQKKVLFFYGTYCVRRHGVWHGAAPRTKKKVSFSLSRVSLYSFCMSCVHPLHIHYSDHLFQISAIFKPALVPLWCVIDGV